MRRRLDTTSNYTPGPPPWELAGAKVPSQPRRAGLVYPDALRNWGDPALLDRLQEARQSTVAAAEALKTATADLEAHYAERRRQWSHYAVPGAPSHPLVTRLSEAQAEVARCRAAEVTAMEAVEAEFKQRWFVGVFIAFGVRDGLPALVRSSLRYALDLRRGAPVARFVVSPVHVKTEADYHQVLFYRVADHPHLSGYVAEDVEPPAPLPSQPNSGRDQSEVEKFRRRVRAELQSAAKSWKEGDPIKTKGAWLKTLHADIDDRISAHLLNEVWRRLYRIGVLPAAWTNKGRRLP